VALLEEYVAATLYQEAQPNRTHFLQAADDQIRLSQLWRHISHVSHISLSQLCWRRPAAHLACA